MRRILLSLPLLLLSLFFALPALAGNWGEDWGTMVWGSVAAVPTMGKLGVLVLILGLGGLATRFIQRSRAATSLLVAALVLPMGSPVAKADTVSVQHRFVNGTPADADQMNANFDDVEAAVNDNDARITEAQNAAEAAALSATTAVTAAANAQSTAAAAQSTASSAQSAATTAQSTADTAAAAATAASGAAETAQSAADAAQSTASSAQGAAAAAQAAADAAEVAVSGELSTQAAEIAALEARILALEVCTYVDRFCACSDGLTVTDTETGLLWERKTTDGSVHDVGNTYTWSSTGAAADGTAYTVFLQDLNTGAGFAGHTDWRLPVISELQSILVGSGVTASANVDPVDPAMGTNPTGQATTCVSAPCIDPRFAAFGGPTASSPSGYWSASSRPGLVNNLNAWRAWFNDGSVGYNAKIFDSSIRAVRAGSCGS